MDHERKTCGGGKNIQIKHIDDGNGKNTSNTHVIQIVNNRFNVDEVITSKKFFKKMNNEVIMSQISIKEYKLKSEYVTPKTYFLNKKLMLYKTEMCRSHSEVGYCKYEDRCQFAHSLSELRDVQRHPKYKTEICKTFWDDGSCPYGKRCCFIHTLNVNFAEVHLSNESSDGGTLRKGMVEITKEAVQDTELKYPSVSNDNAGPIIDKPGKYKFHSQDSNPTDKTEIDTDVTAGHACQIELNEKLSNHNVDYNDSKSTSVCTSNGCIHPDFIDADVNNRGYDAKKYFNFFESIDVLYEDSTKAPINTVIPCHVECKDTCSTKDLPTYDTTLIFHSIRSLKGTPMGLYRTAQVIGIEVLNLKNNPYAFMPILDDQDDIMDQKPFWSTNDANIWMDDNNPLCYIKKNDSKNRCKTSNFSIDSFDKKI